MSHYVRFRLPAVAFVALAALGTPTPPLATVSSPLTAGTAYAQMDAGYLADVEDRKILVTYIDTEDTTDVSLALVPPSPAGTAGITLVLRARFPGRTVDVARLREITLRAHYRVLSDENARAARALTGSHQMHVEMAVSGTSGAAMDFFPTSWGDTGFTAPGDEIRVAWFAITPAELRALALADALKGQVLWSDFVLTPEQLAALRDFAARVLPPPR